MTFNKTLLTATMLTLSGFVAMSANAADTGSFTVAMTVQKSCVVEAGSNITLTAKADDATAPIGSSTFNVACSLDTPYSIAMSPTAGSTNTGESKGTLKSATPLTNTATLDYQLATDSSGDTIWTAGATGNATTGGTGTGTTQNKPFTVYAKVTGDTNLVLPDVYSDTVNISVNY